MKMTEKDYYSILRLPPSCSIADIKKTYRQLALRFHPDLYKGNSTIFSDIKEAYEILSNEELRKKYHQENNLAYTKEQPETIDSILLHSTQLLKYINNCNSFTTEYELITIYLQQLLQTDNIKIIQSSNDTQKLRQIETNILLICQALPYQQLLSVQEIIHAVFPLNNAYYQSLITQKKRTMFWEKYAVLFAISTAIVLCVAMAFIV